MTHDSARQTHVVRQRHEQDDRIHTISRELGVPPETIRNVLLAYNWLVADDPTGIIDPTPNLRT